MILIGTTLEDSRLAVAVAGQHPNLYVSIGIHPHEAKTHNSAEVKQAFTTLLGDSPPEALVRGEKVVAVGECGLDYFYNHSPKEDQIALLKFQIELALEHDLPLSFHVRGAYDDFWPIFDSYKGARGVLHSFTDSIENMKKATDRGLKIGVNGIATFSKSDEQRTMYRNIPNSSLVLETDAPFLTPIPFRGKVCEPGHVRLVAEHLAKVRGVKAEELADQTTENAIKLFGI